MNRNNFIKLFTAGILAVTAIPARADIWCSLFGLNCPQPTRSVDPGVPDSFPPNSQGLTSDVQAAQMVSYLNSHLSAQVIGQSFIPPFYGTSAPTAKYQGVSYYFLHVNYPGKITINLGLVIDKFSRYPSSPGYVLNTIATEVGTSITNPATQNTPSGSQFSRKVKVKK